MSDLQVHRCSRLSVSGDDGNSENINEIKLSDSGDDSDSSMGIPISFSRVLEEHEYTIEQELGKRGSGMVFLVTKDGAPYVIKKINFKNKKEVKILKSLEHGYIVSFVDLLEDKEAGLSYIVMEYCAGGNLFQRMTTQKENGFFEEQQILDWLVQLCLALQCIHANNIIHRDIKPQNVFLTEDDYINLGDFGCSKALERADAYAESVVGAELYVSPEVFTKKYKSKSDIWSLGWLLHDLCMLDVWSDVLERRFHHANSMRGNTPQISERYSEELRKLIKDMLSCDPQQRPSANEILAKPFLNNAVIENKGIPVGLKERYKESLNIFNMAYNEHYANLEAFVKEWGETTDTLKEIHHKYTIGTLSGSVIGAAGSITALVGAILAPFTLGASLIVTGVGIGVGVTGGVTGGIYSSLNTKQQTLHESLVKYMENYKNVSEPILDPLNTLRFVLKRIQKFHSLDTAFDKVKISCSVGKQRVVHATESVHTLRSIAQVKKTHTELCNVLKEINQSRELLNRFDLDMNNINVTCTQDT